MRRGRKRKHPAAASIAGEHAAEIEQQLEAKELGYGVSEEDIDKTINKSDLDPIVGKIIKRWDACDPKPQYATLATQRGERLRQRKERLSWLGLADYKGHGRVTPPLGSEGGGEIGRVAPHQGNRGPVVHVEPHGAGSGRVGAVPKTATLDTASDSSAR